MHYQAAPNEEEKIVAVARGAIYDVALDLRPPSPTFRKWVGLELSAENGRMLYIPAGCAHGFQTLRDDTVVDYKISVPYAPSQARGVRWNDSTFGIFWPPDERVISERDSTYPDFES
jgi:dTDP-4-dehydrorhamnose 3,5-epimerase